MSNTKRVIQHAQEAHCQIWRDGADVSEQTKAAIAVCRAWQGLVQEQYPGRYEAEHGLGIDKVSQKIDLVDTQGAIAYELKMSPKNVHFEFYRDVFKLLVFNRLNRGGALKTLVFITPEVGAQKLRNAFAAEVQGIAGDAGLTVDIAGI